MPYPYKRGIKITSEQEQYLPYYLFFRLRLFLCSIILLAIWIASHYPSYRSVLMEFFTLFA